MTRMHIFKIMLEIVSVIIVLGIAVNLSAALSPQPEPPIYNIGMNTSKGLFSGLIVSIV
jgi:hypothetical protein